MSPEKTRQAGLASAHRPQGSRWVTSAAARLRARATPSPHPPRAGRSRFCRWARGGRGARRRTRAREARSPNTALGLRGRLQVGPGADWRQAKQRVPRERGRLSPAPRALGALWAGPRRPGPGDFAANPPGGAGPQGSEAREGAARPALLSPALAFRVLSRRGSASILLLGRGSELGMGRLWYLV